MAVEDKDAIPIEKFMGLRNTVAPEHFALGDLEAASNIDINDAYRPLCRKGYSTAIVSGAFHSLFAAGGALLAAIGTQLRRLTGTTLVSTTLRTDLTGARLAYAAVGPRVYYSDGLNTGCVDGGTHRTWGIEPPSGQPVASVVGGSLPPGTYQYAVTFAREDGQESGTGLAGSITLPAVGGIAFTAVPTSADPTVVAKHLYVSPVDGDALFRSQTLGPAATTASYYEPVPGTVLLMTQFKQPPIAGTLLAEFNGHVLVARGRRLYWTDPYGPELMDLRRGYTMAGHIVLLAPVDDGVYLGTGDEIIFLSGREPAKFTYMPKFAFGAIAGTSARTDASTVDPGSAGPAVVFGTHGGTIVGLNGGVTKNLTEDRFAYPATDRGASVVRAHGGMTQHVMVLEGTESAANIAG